MAAVSIFTSGALFAFYEGFRTMFGDDHEQTGPARAGARPLRPPGRGALTAGLAGTRCGGSVKGRV